MSIVPGTLLMSRYRAAQLLGRGGMGEVWACLDVEERRTVAIKVVDPARIQEGWMRRLFQAEVVAVARLSHPGIVEVYDLLTQPDGTSLLVMAFRAGKSLSHAVSGGLTWPMIKAITSQLASALAHAHARAVLHLDLKPDNVILRTTPRIETTLVDFGIARVLRPGRGVESWFEDGSVAGTLEYMAPEQYFGEIERLGPWTDLYSLGLLVHCMCTGRLPFEVEGGASASAAQRRMEEPAARMVPKVAGVPVAFVDMVATLLELAPTDRPACAADVLDALAAIDEDTAARADHAPASLRVPPSSASIVPPVSSPPTSPKRPVTARLRPGSVDDGRADSPPSPGAYGLFGLRELPVLGRVDERRQIWEAVCKAVESAGVTTTLLTGPAGTGKTRLARDAVERALELGVAWELSTHWSAQGSPDEGLPGLVENALGSRGRRGDEFHRRVTFFCERFGVTSPAFAREVGVLLRPSRDAAPDAALPLRVACDVIARLASDKPVVLRLDDVHWGRADAERLLAAIRELELPHGLCVLLTERDDEVGEGRWPALDSPAGEVVRVAMMPLGDRATHALIRGLLDLDGELAQVVARRCEGNPLFARQLVAQLVSERAVERREGRYVLARDVDLDRAVPGDMRAVWARTLEASGVELRHLLALALVRDRVSSEVVDALANLLGESFSVAFNLALARGIVRRDGELFAFSHGLLRDYLIEQIPAEQAAELHGLAADALATLSGREDVDEARAHHLFEAERRDEALDAMLAASVWSFRRAEREARQRRLTCLMEWAKDEPNAHARHARAAGELAHCFAEGGKREEATAALERARAALARAIGSADYEQAAAWCALRESQTLRLGGLVLEGARASERGLSHARRAGELEVEAITLAQLGLDAFRKGDNQTARSRYDEALAVLARSGDRATEAQVLVAKAALEEPEAMERHAQRAVEMAAAAGALRIELLARQTWVEGLFRKGDRERAQRETRELSMAAQRRGLRQTVSMVEGVAACWALLEGDFEQAALHHAKVVEWGGAAGAAPERATLAAIELSLALQRGDDVAARAASEVLVREGRTYKEAHFRELIAHLLTSAPRSIKASLLMLDCSRREE